MSNHLSEYFVDEYFSILINGPKVEGVAYKNNDLKVEYVSSSWKETTQQRPAPGA